MSFSNFILKRSVEKINYLPNIIQSLGLSGSTHPTNTKTKAQIWIINATILLKDNN